MAEFLAVPPSKIWLVPGIETITFIDEVALKCVNIIIYIYDETELHVPNIYRNNSEMKIFIEELFLLLI